MQVATLVSEDSNITPQTIAAMMNDELLSLKRVLPHAYMDAFEQRRDTLMVDIAQELNLELEIVWDEAARDEIAVFFDPAIVGRQAAIRIALRS